MDIFFSVIIPAYNSESTIAKCINSVLRQSFTFFELIVIDDGSTDKTNEIIKTFADKRIIYQKIVNSGGPARPRNIGIHLAKGNWICFLDSDDFWATNKLEETFRNISTSPEVDIWSSGYYLFNKYGITSKRLPSDLIDKFSFKTLMIYSNPFVTSAISIRKEKVGGTIFDESQEIASVEDLDFLLSLSKKKMKAAKIDKPLVYYFQNEDGISKNTNKHIKSLKYYFKKNLKNAGFIFKIRCLSNFFWIKSTILYINNDKLNSFSYCLLAIFISPFDRLYYLFRYFKINVKEN